MKALKVIVYSLLIIFAPYLVGLGVDYLMGFEPDDFIMTWLPGSLICLVVLVIIAFIFGGNNDDSEGGGSSDDTSTLMMVTTINTMTATM
jgi:hypothetical protein